MPIQPRNLSLEFGTFRLPASAHSVMSNASNASAAHTAQADMPQDAAMPPPDPPALIQHRAAMWARLGQAIATHSIAAADAADAADEEQIDAQEAEAQLANWLWPTPMAPMALMTPMLLTAPSSPLSPLTPLTPTAPTTPMTPTTPTTPTTPMVPMALDTPHRPQDVLRLWSLDDASGTHGAPDTVQSGAVGLHPEGDSSVL